MFINKNFFYKAYKNKDFPIISSSFLLTGASIFMFGKPKENKKASFLTYVRNASEKLISKISTNPFIPTLPIQETKKPILIFDFENFLITKKFSFFSNKILKRPFTNIFLFNLAHNYEIILLTNLNNENQKLIKKIDPYGCISYRLFIKDKEMFNKEHLNRNLDNCIVITTNDKINCDFENNKINIEKWNGEKDDKLYKMLDFLLKIKNKEKNWLRIIESYKNKEFFTAYENVKKKTFEKNNLFTFNKHKKYYENERKNKENLLNDFGRAKMEMDQHLKRDEISKKGLNLYNVIYNSFLSFI
ncbi:mitochondrial inner membrane protein required for protein import [Gurleya vavrai]